MKRIIAALGMAVFAGGLLGGEVWMTRQACAADALQAAGSGTTNQRRHQGPPPEAYTACEGKKVGGRALFVAPDGITVSGICETADNRLVLRPDHPKEQGQNEHH